MINHCQLYFNLELDRWLFAGKEGHVGSRELLSFTSCCWHLRAVRGAGLGKGPRWFLPFVGWWWCSVMWGSAVTNLKPRVMVMDMDCSAEWARDQNLFVWATPTSLDTKKNPVYLITCYFLLICNLQSWCRTQENRLYVAQLKLKSNPSWNMARLWIAFGLKSLKVILKS